MSEDYTLSFTQANLYALFLILPVTAAYLLPYGWLYGWYSLAVDLVQFIDSIPIFLISIIIGTIVHEFIHAICWSWFDGIPWGRIHFGFQWNSFTPYVHCPDPVDVTNYRWGVVMPGIVLGLIPYVIALALQNGWLLGFALFFTLAAGGDLLILWLLRDVETGLKVQDHPNLVGCRVVKSNKKEDTGNE